MARHRTVGLPGNAPGLSLRENGGPGDQHPTLSNASIQVNPFLMPALAMSLNTPRQEDEQHGDFGSQEQGRLSKQVHRDPAEGGTYETTQAVEHQVTGIAASRGGGGLGISRLGQTHSVG